MNKIVALLKSNLLWTIIGVLAAAAGLYFAFADSHKSASLCLSTGRYVAPDNMDADQAYVIVNMVVFDEDAPHPSLVPVVLTAANKGNETVDNVGMKFYYDVDLNGYNWLIRNTLVENPYSLSLLYYRKGGDAVAIESGGGFSFKQIDPQAVGGVDYKESGVFTPVYFDGFAPGDYQKEKFTVEIKGDNSSVDKYTVVLFNCPIQYVDDSDVLVDRFKTMQKEIAEAVNKENPAVINTVYSFVTYRPEVTIDNDMYFFVAEPSVDKINSVVVNK